MNRLKGIFWILLLIVCILAPPSHARQFQKIEGGDVLVLCDASLAFAARDVISIYPGIKAELESTFLWQIDFKPTVVLIGERQAFEQMAGSRSFVAYALPEKQVIAIDYTRMNVKPFTLGVTLKHELTHLLLHRHITGTALPAWLDEGVSQWISEGIPELIFSGKESLLSQAAFSGRLFRLASLTHSFPEDGQGLALAYEQSRSVVEYIVENYGKNGVLNILEAMRKGAGYEEAMEMALMISLSELERRWAKDQQSLPAILTFLAANVYTLLFVMAALLTFWAYIRLLVRKRRLASQEEDIEDLPS